MIEIESRAEFDAHLRKTQRLNGWFVQSVDLTERTDALLNVDPRGAVFLGCLFAPTVEHHLRISGALLFHGCPTCRLTPTEHVLTTRPSFTAHRTTSRARMRPSTPGHIPALADPSPPTWVPPFMITPLLMRSTMRHRRLTGAALSASWADMACRVVTGPTGRQPSLAPA